MLAEVDSDLVGKIRRLADEVLWPASTAIDRADRVPVEYLDLLADAGLFGMVGPRDAGGSAATPAQTAAVIEALGGASLATAFVWVQHHSTVRAVDRARPEVRDRWLAPLCDGTMRSGIGYAALRRSGPPSMVAVAVGDELRLTGEAPWVTGWGLVDVVLVGARDGDDVVWSLVDAVAAPTLSAEPVRLAAVDSAATVRLALTGHPVPAERVIGRQPFADWVAGDAAGSTSHGVLAVGLAARCAGLLAAPDLIAAVDACRVALGAATTAAEITSARAEASMLALRASAALVAAGGGRSVELDAPAQRLAREAIFLLVFGQTSVIRAAQIAALGVHPG